MKIHVPPIKCQGIKTKLIPWIRDHVELPPGGRWIEPFMGSGAVGFNIRSSTALFADANPHIIAFYNAIKNGYIHANKARIFLEKEGQLLSKKGEEHYYTIRERFNTGGDPFDFLFLSRACFNGVLRFNKQGRYNVPFGHKPQRFSRSYITKIANQIQYVEGCIKNYDWSFVCKDFRIVIEEASKSDFLYFDPPYAGRHTDYFSSWSATDEDDLFTSLVATPAKFILSTWHSNRYRHNSTLHRQASQFTILTKEHFYHVGASESHRNAIVEALVMNYIPKILETTQKFLQ